MHYMYTQPCVCMHTCMCLHTYMSCRFSQSVMRVKCFIYLIFENANFCFIFNNYSHHLLYDSMLLNINTWLHSSRGVYEWASKNIISLCRNCSLFWWQLDNNKETIGFVTSYFDLQSSLKARAVVCVPLNLLNMDKTISAPREWCRVVQSSTMLSPLAWNHTDPFQEPHALAPVQFIFLVYWSL